MSDCAPVQALLVEADPSELRGEGTGTVATHLRTCPRCRAAATAILAASRELDDALSAPAPGPEAVEAVLARAGMAGPRAADAARPFRRSRARAWTWAMGTLAAAAVAGLFLTRGGPGTGPSVASPPAKPALPLLADASARQVAVMPTDDPDITVLWFFQEE